MIVSHFRGIVRLSAAAPIEDFLIFICHPEVIQAGGSSSVLFLQACRIPAAVVRQLNAGSFLSALQPDDGSRHPASFAVEYDLNEIPSGLRIVKQPIRNRIDPRIVRHMADLPLAFPGFCPERGIKPLNSCIHHALCTARRVFPSLPCSVLSSDPFVLSSFTVFHGIISSS